MLKLFLCVVSGLALAIVTLELRQQKLELNYQLSRLHNQIESQQARLWNQQLGIAIHTAPNAISQTVKTSGLKMIPQAPLPDASNWLDPAENPDAE